MALAESQEMIMNVCMHFLGNPLIIFSIQTNVTVWPIFDLYYFWIACMKTTSFLDPTFSRPIFLHLKLAHTDNILCIFIVLEETLSSFNTHAWFSGIFLTPTGF